MKAKEIEEPGVVSSKPARSSSTSANLRGIIETVRDWCQERPVRLCVVFGSQASGKTHVHSDVDVALWPVGPVSPLERLRWLSELENALAKDVSLVLVTSDLDPVMGFEIVRQGCLVFENQSGLWMAQRARMWHAYNDSLPFRRAARQRLREFAEEVRRDS
jgi:predicted nucleotidyltransferase